MDKPIIFSSFAPVFNQLTLGIKLGEGGFGVVYKATYLGDHYAVKQLRADKADERCKQKFQQEIDIMAKLRSPHIVSIYNHISAGPYTIVMEYMPRGSLYDLLQNKQAPLAWLLRYPISLAIGKGIHFLHSEKIIHRDLKSPNVLLDDKYHAKLSDFGLAKVLEESGHATTDYAISWPWTAPEVLDDKPATFASDIYAYGMVLWEIAAWQVPFADAKSKAAIINKIAKGEREKMPNSAPLIFQQAINAAWQQEPDKRPDALMLIEQLNKGWQQYAEQTLNHPTVTKRTDLSDTLPSESLTNATSAPGAADYLQGWALLEKCQYRLALPYFEKAAEASYPPSYLWLSWLYSEGGFIGPKNFEKYQRYAKQAAQQFNWFSRAAQSGKAHDQFNLGVCYAKGQGVKQDDDQAVTWYQKAADQGDANAQFALGVCYAKGYGVKQEQALAIAWYQKAADQGNANAQYVLGVRYTNGQGVKQDHAQAVAWYQKAADQGHASTQRALGWCHEHGQGVKQDLTQAVAWYQKAADQGHAVAQFALGACYAKGYGIKQDLIQAVAWYQKAADQDDANAQFALGACYAKGCGIKQDLTQAVAWYQKAADQGDAHAQCNLGVHYANGQGVKQNHTQAAAWYQKAADKGNVYAQCNLGKCYEKGQGVKQDHALAAAWYQKAADQGHVNAKAMLNTLLQQHPSLQSQSPATNPSALFSPKSSQPPATNNNATAQPSGSTLRSPGHH